MNKKILNRMNKIYLYFYIIYFYVFVYYKILIIY